MNFVFRVVSPIDKKPMDGIPSIRVHHGLDFANTNHIIRWTEVFILKVNNIRYFEKQNSISFRVISKKLYFFSFFYLVRRRISIWKRSNRYVKTVRTNSA